MIAPYIIDRNKKEESINQIQLEIPDYTQEYMEWVRKKEQENKEQPPDTVIIIDIY